MITIVVLNWNGGDDTIRCLESLSNLRGGPANILICDNGSEDDSLSIIRRTLFSLDGQDSNFSEWDAGDELDGSMYKDNMPYYGLIKSPRNLGFSGGVNVGLRLALQDPRMSAVWILNNDTVVDAGALEAIEDALFKNPKAGIIGTTLLYLDEPEKIQAVGGLYNPWLGTTSHVLGQKPYSRELCESVDPQGFDYVVGASFCIRREVIEVVGLLSEDYFLYFEELDYAKRMKRLMPDYRLGYEPNCIVYHKEGGSMGAKEICEVETSELSDCHFLTSRQIFASRNSGLLYPLVHVTLLGILMTRIYRGHWVSVRHVIKLFMGIEPVIRP